MNQTQRKKRIAIIGAGPIGLEAALLARSLGFDVVVMDARDVGANVAAWGFVPMFTSWAMNTTPLGRAVAGNNPLLSSDRCPTGTELLERYLLPIAGSRELENCIDIGVKVLAVGCDCWPRPAEQSESPTTTSDRAPFWLLVCDRTGVEQMDRADFVLDCSGTYGNPRWAGPAGVPAPGEIGMKQAIWYNVPDVLGRDRVQFAGRHTLLIGTGTSAATILMNLGRLAKEVEATKVTWAFRRWGQILRLVDEDPLPARRALVEQVLHLTAAPPPWLELIENAQIESLSASRGKSAVLRRGGELLTRQVDEIVAAVGYRPDESLTASLGGRPEYIAASQTRGLLEYEDAYGMDAQFIAARHDIVSPVPGYYLLGAKSYGTNSNFLLRVGHRQVHDVFSYLVHESTTEDCLAESAIGG